MLYKFNEFEFDSKDLILTQKDNVVPLRHNEARVLALLLENSNKVLSKDAILADVWQDKIVSEQAVFQNISQLRSVFGSDSIKTFSKRGYQWQLEIVVSEPQPDADPHTDALSVEPTHNQNSLSTRSKRPYFYALLLFFCIISTALYATYSPFNHAEVQTSSVPRTLAYIPFTEYDSNTTTLLEDTSSISFTPIPDLKRADFIATSEVKFPMLKAQYPLLLTGKFRTHQDNVYLDFLIKSEFSEWKGQLMAASKQDVIKRFNQHLTHNAIYERLKAPLAPEVKQAKLLIAHQSAPEDLVILNQLVNSYIKTLDLEKAMSLAEKLSTLANESGNLQQVGNALLYQSRILTNKSLYQLSEEKLHKAIEYFEMTGGFKWLSDALISQSWLAHQKDDYALIKANLLESSRLAYEAKDVLRELGALTYLSVMAHKHKQQQDKYLYLHQAQSKIKTYQLPEYHLATISFHYAIFAKSAMDKEPHLKQVLMRTALTPDIWVAQESRKILLRGYLQQKRYIDAEALLKTLTSDNVHNSYLKALFAQSQHQDELIIKHAQRTFEQAQFSGEIELSLDAALILYGKAENPDYYLQYLKENVTPYWRSDNKDKLAALTL